MQKNKWTENSFRVMKTPFEYENFASFLKWASCKSEVWVKEMVLAQGQLSCLNKKYIERSIYSKTFPK